MGIKKEHRDLVKELFNLRSELESKKDRKTNLEENLRKEIQDLEEKERQLGEEIGALKREGILYCEDCNELYPLSDPEIQGERQSTLVFVPKNPRQIFHPRADEEVSYTIRDNSMDFSSSNKFIYEISMFSGDVSLTHKYHCSKCKTLLYIEEIEIKLKPD